MNSLHSFYSNTDDFYKLITQVDANILIHAYKTSLIPFPGSKSALGVFYKVCA